MTCSVADLMPACSPSLSSSNCDLVAVLLGPAHVHAQQHLGPVLRLGAAGAGIDLDVAVVGVGLARQQAFDLAPLGFVGQRAQRRHRLGDHRGVALGLGQLDQFQRVGDLALELAARPRSPRRAGCARASASARRRRRSRAPGLRRGRSVRRGGLRRHPSQRCLLSSATDCLICSLRASDSADMMVSCIGPRDRGAVNTGRPCCCRPRLQPSAAPRSAAAGAAAAGTARHADRPRGARHLARLERVGHRAEAAVPGRHGHAGRHLELQTGRPFSATAMKSCQIGRRRRRRSRSRPARRGCRSRPRPRSPGRG